MRNIQWDFTKQSLEGHLGATASLNPHASFMTMISKGNSPANTWSVCEPMCVNAHVYTRAVAGTRGLIHPKHTLYCWASPPALFSQRLIKLLALKSSYRPRRPTGHNPPAAAGAKGLYHQAWYGFIVSPLDSTILFCYLEWQHFLYVDNILTLKNNSGQTITIKFDFRQNLSK